MWINDFMQFTSIAEPCPRYRLFTALFAIGAGLGRKVWVKLDTSGLLIKPYYPNLWIMLIGPSAEAKKSSTINLAYALFEHCKNPIRLTAHKVTPEGLFKALGYECDSTIVDAKDAVCSIVSPELALFLGKQKYNAGMIELLTDFYECPSYRESETILRGRWFVKNVCLSQFVATTMDWLQYMVPEEVFTGGFLARYIPTIFPEGYAKKATFLNPSLEEWVKLVDEYDRLVEIEGEFRFTPEAKEWFEQWYSTTSFVSQDKMWSAYLGRRPENVLKVGMILEICETKSLLLRKQSLSSALGILVDMDEDIQKMYSVSASPGQSVEYKIVYFLKINNNELPRSGLLQRMFKFLPNKTKDFDNAISYLIDIKMIAKTKKQGETWYHLEGEL